MNNERHIKSHLSAKTERVVGGIVVTERGQTMSLHGAAIGVLRETGLVLGQSEFSVKTGRKKNDQ